ncbi:hypothetical protein [Acinetobacter variabilis]|uniref:Uncharacterized protein n=1 Tax=Acinetobacter variabilis TaxID=70346 RepID=N8WYJ7_9GAMM|nr:hypothetical protein [Acinetobacter variabilis]ENV00353.1 hypothetical protein F969_00584 [Acinetobacter variabilis]
MDINTTALKVTTPHGEFYAIFPDDARNCELCGPGFEAIGYFEDNLHKLFKQHGYPLELSSLEPDELMTYGNREDLQIVVTDEFDRQELALL